MQNFYKNLEDFYKKSTAISNEVANYLINDLQFKAYNAFCNEHNIKASNINSLQEFIAQQTKGRV